MRKLLLPICFVLFSPLTAVAQFSCEGDELAETRIEQVVKTLEKRYRELDGLQASFRQDSLFLGFNQRVQSEGKVLFKKPGMMDWNYLRPEKQRFVADGRTLWFHQPEMNQVTVGQFQQSFQSGLPVSFLLGLGSISEDFNVLKGCKSAEGIVLSLAPKTPDPSLEEFKLLIDPKEHLPQGAHIVDVGGNETQIVFSNIRTDIALEESQFRFQIPKGVDIIDQRDGAGLEQ